MGPNDRLNALKKQQTAWNSLDWAHYQTVHMLEGDIWELYGGVLAQGRRSGPLGFRQLPSHYRGIEERVWGVHVPGIALRDFTMDPSQDLLVLIDGPQLQTSARDAKLRTIIHLRTLAAGKPHPQAVSSGVLVHDVDIRAGRLSFAIQVCGDHVAIHFISSIDSLAEPELAVWNWKTGNLKLNVTELKEGTFAFVDNRYMLVAGTFESNEGLTQPRLVVFDLEWASGEKVSIDDVEYLCAFDYPPFDRTTDTLAMSIRSDPTPVWTPHPKHPVPFTTARLHRLYVITTWVRNGDDIVSYDLFVPSGSFLSHIHRVSPGTTRRNFDWDEWGPMGTRLMRSPPHSSIWVCYVFGTKFVFLRIPTQNAVQFRNGSRTVEVWDFNQLALKRDLSLGKHVDDENARWHTDDTSIVSDGVFAGAVRTTFPYRVITRALPPQSPQMPKFQQAMCSEDSIILVDSQGRNFGILTF
ncbi:hypothetical protein BV22DRAFT_1029582 [Leucogyrophana mollusca]|uniref:Uncharacterized protein n=1 Tax=Leucogyrophana mollusca TaxID=85980 RepID=A0ACB8BUF4_9AGAM|nr:hypothetical protein BV22DRAFT_1029582 [Leucogyrophana mollusca]